MSKPVDLTYYSLLSGDGSQPEMIIHEFQDRGWEFIRFLPSPSPRSIGFHFQK